MYNMKLAREQIIDLLKLTADQIQVLDCYEYFEDEPLILYDDQANAVYISKIN